MAVRKKPGKAQRQTTSCRKPVGWNTSDEDEIARRVARAEKEPFKIKNADADNAVFSDWLVTGASGASYRVEMRSMHAAINSCGCKDFQVNRLGTCKHIEAVRRKFAKRKRSELEQGHPRVEIYLDRRDNTVNVSFPDRMRKNTRARQVLAGFFNAAGKLRGDPMQSMALLKNRLSDETRRVRHQVRISPHLEQWLLQLQQAADLRAARRRFERELNRGGASLDVVKLPLYPYQQEGMLHLAFTGRALLADEMGLGKTVQAIAGSELLDRLHSIEKVLVVAPASLKSEWAEQIHKFSERQALIIQGMRKRRYRLYEQPAFYYLANYEQMLHDKDYINDELKPDLIILDEAQRIKNWQTKTADAIRQLQSPYAFVLTGTPLENRIDEIYSITQFLDPGLFGPLFRFNREFHQLDDRGLAVGYKNLDRLHERLRHKTGLAEEVVDGAGKITEMEISAGRGSFMERLDDLLAEATPRRSPLQQFTEHVVAGHADRVEHLEQRGNAILAVVDKADSELAGDIQRHLNEHYDAALPQLEMLDRATFETLQRLAKAGVIQFNHPVKDQVYNAQSDSDKEAHEKQRRQALSRKHLKAAAEKQRMSQLLADGGFITEALTPMSEALNKALAAVASSAAGKANGVSLSIAQVGDLQAAYELPADTVSTTAALRHESEGLSDRAAKAPCNRRMRLCAPSRSC